MTTRKTTVPTFKVLLLGDGAVGKSTWIRRHRTGEFDRRYNGTMGVEVHMLKFHTNQGPIAFEVWEVAGMEKAGGLRDLYYHKAEAAIIMFAVDSKLTYKNVPRWHQDVSRNYPKIPVVICGNKQDLPPAQHKIKPKDINYHRKKSLDYFGVSAKTNYHFFQPFLRLARLLISQDINFTTPSSLEPPEIFLHTQTSKL